MSNFEENYGYENDYSENLSDYSNYMVASQECEPGAGWDYKFLEKVDSSLSSVDLGKTIKKKITKYILLNNK